MLQVFMLYVNGDCQSFLIMFEDDEEHEKHDEMKFFYI